MEAYKTNGLFELKMYEFRKFTIVIKELSKMTWHDYYYIVIFIKSYASLHPRMSEKNSPL